ncbi:tripartite tricarboxylate transporter substrate binding protein [Polymorphum gilvum]|uniref:Recombinase A n=1 Tax=Polymorphum gilvum (strain LMG 25793 / CGMCC 1.9160 / SL003B-26A1) TaxID=991905 RepID=F2IZJ1_POLGS|nr:tripartite tricarboxylate transporter substrate binding protein [Polymorphum gilvum]ADZ69548.1 Recombinase A [Polymorphum gilvum SL003B-26A1]
MTRNSLKSLTAALFAATLVLPGVALAEFPDKPITMYIGFAPGGAVDTTARLLIENLEKELGVPVVAVQQPGGGGAVMAASLMNLPADGYSIGMGASAAFVLSPVYNKSLPYTMDDLDHIATVSYPEDALVVRKDAPWNSYEDLIKDARDNKRVLTLSSQVAVSRLMAIALEQKEGIDIDVIPTQGGGAGIQQVLGGHTDMTWGASGWHQLVQAGELKPLFSLGYKRNETFSNIPTLRELGHDYAFVDTFMLSAPKGLPADVLERLTKAVEAALTDDLKQQLHERMFLTADYRNPQDTLAYLRKQQEEVMPFLEAMLAEDAKK